MKDSFKVLVRTILSDLYRYSGDVKFSHFIYHYFNEPGFKVTTLFRLCRFFRMRKKSILLPVYYFILLLYKRNRIRFGIDLNFGTQIGKGFYIGHYGSIIVSEKAVVGENVNISQGVTVGRVSRGPNMGFPTIGNNVYIGAGAKVIGKISIGSNVSIGANCVVTKDIPDNSVVVGIPGKVISNNGSDGYINRTDYGFLWEDQVV